jgi:hypothetical protein
MATGKNNHKWTRITDGADANYGLRRVAPRHAAFARTKRAGVFCTIVRPKAVSPLPLCHRTPKLGSRVGLAVLSEPFVARHENIRMPSRLLLAALRSRRVEDNALYRLWKSVGIGVHPWLK